MTGACGSVLGALREVTDEVSFGCGLPGPPRRSSACVAPCWRRNHVGAASRASMADGGAREGGAGAGRVRLARFNDYRAAECAALAAALDAHADVALRRATPHPHFAVAGADADAAGGDGAGDRAGFYEMLRGAEVAARAFGITCTHRARGGMPPSLDTLDLGNAVLQRGDIAARGRVAHEMLVILSAGRAAFVLPRGNPYVVGSLYAGDLDGVYSALCRAVGIELGAGVPAVRDRDDEDDDGVSAGRRRPAGGDA